MLYICRYNDPPYVKVKKLEVLTELCNVDNAQNIVDELGWGVLFCCNQYKMIMCLNIASVLANETFY